MFSKYGVSRVAVGIALGLGMACSSLSGWAAPERTKDQAIMDKVEWTASWIWAARESYTGYNDTIEARKSFSLPEAASANLRITADTWYRLYVNETWVNDGPSRSWPNHYQYDIIDVAPYLKVGANEIRIIAKFYGIGTFHQVPQEAGLLAQLDVTPKAGGAPVRIGTDATWEVREASGWAKWAPKQSVQMGPFENYDARKASEGDTGYAPAVSRYAAAEGPWKNLEPRDCPLLTRIPFAAKALHGSAVVEKSPWKTFIFPTAPWVYDGVVYSNNKVAVTGAYATIIDLKERGLVTIDADENKVLIDGTLVNNGKAPLMAGKHFVLIVLAEYFGHWRHDTELRLTSATPMTLENPLDASTATPWCFAAFNDSRIAYGDTEWKLLSQSKQDEITAKLDGLVNEAAANGSTLEAFRARATAADSPWKVRTIQADESTESPHFLFENRKPLKDIAPEIKNPEAAIKGEGDTIVSPNAQGDVELCFDLGEQNIGYYQFALTAEAGLIVDISGVEYITPQGRVQHTERYRNAMRYCCKEGMNDFTSLMRRSGRYIFVTLRNQTKPATLHAFRLIESTYPVQPIGRFACSDPRLGKIWDISARTLKLCMEDTFTDCPLYEQTLWVGDSRNEAIFGYTAFGSDDMGRRCTRLAAYSLEKQPMVMCQVPSTWEILLPAWSFQWGMMAWDNYLFSGDKDFLAWAYPYMVRNLKGAAQYTDSRGLFSGPFWNMFDWSGIDDGHNTVLHNSMFIVGAADDALKTAEVIGTTQDVEWIKAYRRQLVDAINALWDDERGVYPDSVHEDGEISKKASLHTGFLGLLYDIVPQERRQRVLDWVLNPPEGVTPVGAPFAIMYLFDALEKEGQGDAVIQAIYRDYQPMLDLDATTVWETFARGTTGSKGFPTRSHCHAWSSAPIQFLNRIILGIVPEAPGGAAYRISPRLNGLEWAEGASAGAKGPVTVSWKRSGDTLTVDAKGPEGVALRFEKNNSLDGLKVIFNGQAL